MDPRRGDIEDDASSTKRRSLLSLAGSLLAEISLPKLAVAFTLLVVIPGLVLGIAPIVAAIWFGKLSSKLASALAGVWPAILLVIVIAVGWFGGRPLLRLAENSFWSLNSLVVQPAYTVCREALRQLAERLLPARASKIQRARLRAAAALVSGGMICGVALLVLMAVLPHADLLRGAAGVGSPEHLAVVALANTVALIAGYLAAAALVWGIADATMAQPRDLEQFDQRPEGGRTWRIAHLSDVHVVGERYGFRLESGRSGPRGNERLTRLLAELETLHARDPLHAIVVSGDMTDAGRSSEWAEFLDAVLRHPRLAERMLIIPGNHDLNIVDRANPARLDLPTSPNKRLRKLRVLSAMGVVQGERVRMVDRARRCLGATLASMLEPHLKEMATFADIGRPWLSKRLTELWTSVFPMVLPPDSDEVWESFCSTRTPTLLHQCAGHDYGRSSPRLGHRLRAVPLRLLGRRPAPSRRRVSPPGKGAIRACGNRFDQRQLVCPATQAARRPGGADARSPAHRLDRGMRRHSHSLRAVPGDGSDRRRGHVFLHPHVGRRIRPAPQIALAAADHRRGRTKLPLATFASRQKRRNPSRGLSLFAEGESRNHDGHANECSWEAP
jgi:hypothetical protein